MDLNDKIQKLHIFLVPPITTKFIIYSGESGKKKNKTICFFVYFLSYVNSTIIVQRFKSAQALYDEVLNNKDDEESKISLSVIDNIASLFANFAKHG